MKLKPYRLLSFTLLVFLPGCLDSTQNTSSDTQTSAQQHPAEPVTDATSGETQPLWLTDYQQALEIAREKNRHVLINFTGSDWCVWCIRLKKEILDTEDFKKYAEDKLVLLEIDFPHRKQLPPEQQEANRELQEKFGVKGFPTLFLLNAEGKTIRELGYMPGGPKAFIAALQSAES